MIEQTKSILADLIAYPTVSTESNLEMINDLANRLESAGAKVEVMHDESGRKANLWATLGPQVDGGIVLSGHTDVVPVTDQPWSSDPFVLTEQEDKLFGRGTCDMKGFIAATIAMVPRFAESIGSKPIHFAFTHDEETGCIGAGHLAEALKERPYKPSIAIIGEPTSMQVIEGHKGCYEYSTKFKGLEGHGSDPDRGVNAVEYAVRYVNRLLELRKQLQARAPKESAFEPPWTTINVGALKGGTVPNVIAAQAQVEWEMRPVQNSDATFVKQSIRSYCENELLPAMHAVYPDACIETQVLGEVAGLVPTDENEARALVSQLVGANGAGLVPFGTEAGIFQSLGMDVVVCGPGSIDQAHRADEYLSSEQLQKCLDMLEKLGRKIAD